MTYEPNSRPAPETGLNNGEMTRAAKKFIEENELDPATIPANGGRIELPHAKAHRITA